MQSTFLKTVGNKPHFSILMADESPGEKITFFKTLERQDGEEDKVFFSPSKIFLVRVKGNVQQSVEVRERSSLTSLIGETERLRGEFL